MSWPQASARAADLMGGRDPGRVLDVVGLLARLVLGIVLVVAGGLKVTSPDASAMAVRAYQILPYDVAGDVGHALPVLEIAVGMLLVTGLFIDCGCFGGGGTIEAARTQYPLELYPLELARDAGLVLCAAWLVVRPATAYGHGIRSRPRTVRTRSNEQMTSGSSSRKAKAEAAAPKRGPNKAVIGGVVAAVVIVGVVLAVILGPGGGAYLTAQAKAATT